MIQKITLTLYFILLTGSLYAQKQVEELIYQGIEYHDAGAYDKAIETYRQALQIDPHAVNALYEISLSLFESGDYLAAIAYCDKLLEREDKYAILSYNTKGSCLNHLDRTDEAIEVFLEGIERYDAFHSLHYNLGLAYFKKTEYTKAKESFIHSLNISPQHAGSHLNLGRTLEALDRKIESLLCLYYFLLLEPQTDRSVWAYQSVQDQLFDLSESKTIFPQAERRLVDSLMANEKAAVKEADALTLFTADTQSFFHAIASIEHRTGGEEGIWWDYYITFFRSLSQKEFTDVFCHYIRFTAQEKNQEWMDKNKQKVKSFSQWLKQQ